MKLLEILIYSGLFTSESSANGPFTSISAPIEEAAGAGVGAGVGVGVGGGVGRGVGGFHMCG